MGVALIGHTFDDRMHEIVMSKTNYEECRVEIVTWLVDNFGYDEDSGLWDLWEWSLYNSVHFLFRYERDAMAFKLAWM